MPVRIGCSSGFWGDTSTAAEQLLTQADPPLDYLVGDYLAEVTMGLLSAGRARKRGGGGFIDEFVSDVFAPLLPLLAKGRTRLITNAGGLDPLGLKAALEKACAAAGIAMEIAAVVGDDVAPRWGELRRAAMNFAAAPGDDADKVPETPLSANAYLGARPIAEALALGARVVVTGRCVDSALVLGPLAYEFGWRWDDYDRIASGCACGHIVECGAQCSGGNFTDWRLSRDAPGGGWENGGFPIADCEADGSFVITKPANTGGVVNVGTVAEQLLYEIGDPAAYLLPDAVCDFSGAVICEAPGGGVRVSGVRGRGAPRSYKVSLTSKAGFWIQANMVIVGEDAAEKAHSIGTAVVRRAGRVAAAKGFGPYLETRIDALGAEALYGPHASQAAAATREVVLRVAATHSKAEPLALLSKEMAPAFTCMAPGVMSSLTGGRARPAPLVKHAAALLPKELVQWTVHAGTKPPLTQAAAAARNPSSAAAPAPSPPPPPPPPASAPSPGGDARVPLSALAYARSGDKGDMANVGVIARRPEVYPYLRRELTVAVVKGQLGHFAAQGGQVHRFDLPGLHAMNFLLTKALGGGGLNSLSVDRQGKGFAQQLLSLEVSVPKAIAASCGAVPAPPQIRAAL